MDYRGPWRCEPEVEWPLRIKISGLPFWFGWWNRVFSITGERSDGLPVYHMPGYKHFWYGDIVGASIMRFKGQWIVKRDCEEARESHFLHKSAGDQKSPIGFWSHDAIVTEENWMVTRVCN
jgi:hypothetical protein